MSNIYRKLLFSAGSLVGVLIIASLLFSTQLKGWFYSRALPTTYFSHFEDIEPALYLIAGNVYAFELGFTRSMVVRSKEGIAVFDTFSDHHADEMKKAIAAEFPGEEVKWVVFSHNHFDHIRGSHLFEGAEVIGHRALNSFVEDWPEAGQGVAAATRHLSGDETLFFGEVEVQALYMPFSHSHTLYGFHLPEDDVVFAPDMMFVKTIPPFDFPDFYYSGYVRALDRLIELNSDHYIPSHGWRGGHADLVDYRNMTVDFEETVKRTFFGFGPDAAEEGTTLRKVLQASYPELKAKYGDWHGFEDMFVPKFARHLGGTYLGY